MPLFGMRTVNHNTDISVLTYYGGQSQVAHSHATDPAGSNEAHVCLREHPHSNLTTHSAQTVLTDKFRCSPLSHSVSQLVAMGTSSA